MAWSRTGDNGRLLLIGLWEQISVIFEWKYKTIHTKNELKQKHLQNGDLCPRPRCVKRRRVALYKEK